LREVELHALAVVEVDGNAALLVHFLSPCLMSPTSRQAPCTTQTLWVRFDLRPPASLCTRTRLQARPFDSNRLSTVNAPRWSFFGFCHAKDWFSVPSSRVLRAASRNRCRSVSSKSSAGPPFSRPPKLVADAAQANSKPAARNA